MLAIVLTVCLAADPSICREERTIPEQITELSCHGRDGQTEAIKWLNDHPKWMLSGWRCEPIGREKRDA
jgi:hypothetical protein